MPPRNPKMILPLIVRELRRRSSVDPLILSRPQRILLVKQSERLGNIVLMNSAISGLASAFSGVRIDLLLPAAYAEIMSLNRYLNNIIPIAKREYFLRPWTLASLISSIRRTGYDIAINCSDVNSQSATEALYTLVSGAKVTAGWKISDRSVFDIEVVRYPESVHATEMYVRLFSGVFGRHLQGTPYFESNPQRRSSAGEKIGINCGGRGAKRWPLENFIELGRRLAGKGMEIEFILGPDEKRFRPILARNLPGNSRLLPEMPLGKLIGCIEAYKVFISSDTGPMHLAWCLGVPTIAIFTDSELPKFRPLSPGSTAVYAGNGVLPEPVMEKIIDFIPRGEVSK